MEFYCRRNSWSTLDAVFLLCAAMHARLPGIFATGGADLVAEDGGSTRMTSAMSTSAIRRVVSFNNAATCLCAMRYSLDFAENQS
jgi:hypothetical protein